MKNKFIKLLMTFFGVSIMYLVAVGSGSSPVSSYTYDYSKVYPHGSADAICDNFIITKYWYRNDYKAMSYGMKPEHGWTCYSRTGSESQEEVISLVLDDCRKEAYYCKIMAIGNDMHGPTKWRKKSKSNQNYTGENKVCNSSVPGGCTGAFKP